MTVSYNTKKLKIAKRMIKKLYYFRVLDLPSPTSEELSRMYMKEHPKYLLWNVVLSVACEVCGLTRKLDEI